jgi:hypothetical protein
MDDTIVMMFWIGYIAFLAIMIASGWVIFKKAGKPGWASIVPIYSGLVLLQIIGRPWWWILLFLLAFIPFVGWLAVLVLSVIVCHDLAVSFGKGWGYTVGMVLLGFVFMPMLAFGDATYKGPAAKAA